jgi:ketopantoate reductase
VRTLEPGGFSWLHDDLVNGGRMELEALLGTVVRSAAAHDLRVRPARPCTLLKPWAVRNGRQAG